MNLAAPALDKTLNLLALAAIATALVAYGLFLYANAINVPFADDIYDVLEVLVQLHHTDSLHDALATLFAQHNDHRTLASRLAYLGIYAVSGEIDFRALVFIANLALPVFLLLFLAASKHNPHRYLVVAGAALLLLNLRCYGITLWSMAAFAYHFSFLYAFLAIFALRRANLPRVLAAAVFAALSTFSLASGQLTWIVGFVYLCQQRYADRSLSGGYLLLWAVMGALVLWAWRYQLDTPNTMFAVLANFADHPGHYVLYTLTLLGSFSSESSVALAASCGALLLTALSVTTLRALRDGDPRLAFCGWLVALSAAAVVLGRGHFTTVDYALSSRYGFPSTLMAATVWTALANQFHTRALLPGLVVCAAGWYCAHSYRDHGDALQPYTDKRIQRYNNQQFWAYGKPLKQSNAIVQEAIELGIYRPPQRPLRLAQPAPGNGE